jgi:proteasome accessory factor C
MGALYLNAYCHFASGYRTFRLDRIQVLGEVEIESEKNLEAGLGRGLQSATPSVLEVRVLAQARRYMEIFKGEFRQGSIVSNFFNTQWLLRVIIASGGDLELISPEDLRPEIAAGARKILALYSS